MMESVQAGQVDALVRLVTQHAVAGRLSHADRHGAMLCLARIKWYDRAFMQVCTAWERNGSGTVVTTSPARLQERKALLYVFLYIAA